MSPEDRAGGRFEKRPCARVQGPPGRQVAPENSRVSHPLEFYVPFWLRPRALNPHLPGGAKRFCAREQASQSDADVSDAPPEAPASDQHAVSRAPKRVALPGGKDRMYSTVAPGGRKRVSSLACAGPHFLRFWSKPGLGKKRGIRRHRGVTVMDINY